MTRAVSFSLAFAVAFAVGLAVRLTSSDVVTQPIPYNHAIHIENDLVCTDCHVGAEVSRRATIPNIEICADCHDETTGESEAERFLVRSVQEAEPIPWKRVGLLPDHVFFSHRRHTTVATIECETCHGEIASLHEPPGEALLVSTMDACLKCHQDQGATDDCNACHH